MTHFYETDCRVVGGPLAGTGPLMAFETFCLVGIPPGIRVSPSVFWFLYLTTLSRLLLAVTITSRPRLPIPRRRYRDIQVFLLVVRILSSTPLPGFIGPESSVLSVNLPPSGPYPLRGLLIRYGFLTPLTAFNVRPGGLPWVRRTASPYPVQLHFGSVHRISGLALSRLLDLLPAAI